MRKGGLPAASDAVPPREGGHEEQPRRSQSLLPSDNQASSSRTPVALGSLRPSGGGQAGDVQEAGERGDEQDPSPPDTTGEGSPTGKEEGAAEGQLSRPEGKNRRAQRRYRDRQRLKMQQLTATVALLESQLAATLTEKGLLLDRVVVLEGLLAAQARPEQEFQAEMEEPKSKLEAQPLAMKSDKEVAVKAAGAAEM